MEGYITKLINKTLKKIVYLGQPIEWKPWEDEIREIFDSTEAGKYHPVCKPLCQKIFYALKK